MTKKIDRAAVCTALTFIFLTADVYANSSWVWLSTARPYWLLPAAALVTLIAESYSVIKIAGVEKKTKAAAAVCIANLISFAAPYLALILFDEGFGMKYYLEHTQFYTVGFVFLLMTVACETPVVYNLLKKDVPDKRKLLKTVVVSNIATTVFCAALERIFCYGKW